MGDIPRDFCTSSHLPLRTSLDLTATLRATEILEATLYPLEGKNVHNGAILAIEPKTEKILVYVGNRNESTGNAIDMVSKRRSVGSVLKPFLYLIGLHSDMDPSDLILDDTKVYQTGNNGVSYISENYNPKSYGPITLREALGNSLNSATVRLSEHIGIGRIYASLRSLGFPLEREAGYYGYTIMLGGIELSLEEVVDGYKNLANLLDGENFLLYDMLSDGMNRAMTFGVSSILNTSIPLAVKTGTSTDFRDNWTIGYNESIIIGVWVGNVDRSSMDDISGVTGA
jgi:penicillin-binding protein 1C